jgi:holo-[acyl-carrier protein] synthase
MQVGIDLINLSEFKQRMERIAAESIFADTEMQQNASSESLAGVFAAKEAFMKALGRKVDWREIWVEKLATGQPVLKSDLITAKQSTTVSISHDGDYAIAVVIIY